MGKSSAWHRVTESGVSCCLKLSSQSEETSITKTRSVDDVRLLPEILPPQMLQMWSNNPKSQCMFFVIHACKSLTIPQLPCLHRCRKQNSHQGNHDERSSWRRFKAFNTSHPVVKQLCVFETEADISEAARANQDFFGLCLACSSTPLYCLHAHGHEALPSISLRDGLISLSHLKRFCMHMDMSMIGFVCIDCIRGCQGRFNQRIRTTNKNTDVINVPADRILHLSWVTGGCRERQFCIVLPYVLPQKI